LDSFPRFFPNRQHFGGVAVSSMKMATMDPWAQDEARIAAAQAGDTAALEALLTAAWPHAYRIALSVLRTPAAAEDAAQEACARVVLAIGQVRSREAFGVWFYRLVVREALAIERRTRRHEPLDPRTLGSASPLTDALVRIDVLRALGELAPAQRAVIALHYYADLNSREIAAILRIPDGTVRYHLTCARRRLEVLLASHQPRPLAEVLFDAG
jgi:RNA polymerase sigma factor (sigma-70 family)